MAIAHFRSKIIGQGVSPIAAAAYRHRTSLHDAAIGQTFSYSADKDLVHAELSLPDNTPQWFRDLVDGRTPEAASEALWNAVLDHEKRADAQYAREIVIALPLELSRQENITLVQDYVSSELTSRGFVVDWVFHDKPGNPHAHLMHTLRPLEAHGFGPKRIALRDDAGVVQRDAMGGIRYRHFAGTRADFVAMRQAWGEIASRHLAAAGHDLVVDMRSFADRGIAVEPTTHLGAAVSGLRRDRRPSFVSAQLDWENADRIQQVSDNPDLVLELITQERSTFGDADIARVLNRFVDDPDTFQNILAAVKGTVELVVLRPDLVDPESGRTVAPAIYSTRTMVTLEHRMVETASLLHQSRTHAMRPASVADAIAAVEGGAFKLSDEQQHAVQHVTGADTIAAIVGRAGTGKSTLLKAANGAWTVAGYRVLGAALAGKAAESLETSSGISSRTIAAWQHAWAQGRDQLQKDDVLVLDEAGMVSSRQMAALVSEVHVAGAKLVLVGDPEQLQPIEAGAAFRAIVERIGFAELSEVRRQTVPWMQAASRDLASGHADRALKAYQRHNALETLETTSQAIELLVHHWNAARSEDGKAMLLALAHTNADVLAINAAIRGVMTERGALADPIPFETARGPRTFAAGDRVLFLENRQLPSDGTPAGSIAVKNGSLGTVNSTAAGALTVTLDTGASVQFDAVTYTHIDHGYAATIHKAQGATVDHAFVLASPGMDRHLAYVAFSRHRKSLKIYAPQETLGRRSLADIVSRSGAKTTSLDYADPASLAAMVRRRGADALADWVDAVRARFGQMRLHLGEAVKRLRAVGARLATAQSASVSSESAANSQQQCGNRDHEQLRRPLRGQRRGDRDRPRMFEHIEALTTQWRAGKRKAVQAGAPRSHPPAPNVVSDADLAGLKSNMRDGLTSHETVSTATANISTATTWINADVTRPAENRIASSAWRTLTSHVSRVARRRGSASSPSSTAKEITHGTSPMQTNIEHSKLEVEGSTARVSFDYDKTANETFLRVVGSGKAQFQDGAWQIKLPDDERQRDTALGKIELAQRSIEPRLKDMAQSQAFSEGIAARHPQSDAVEVTARNSALAVRIPPVQDAIKELKALGAHWIPKNEKTEAGGYWRLAIKDATHATVVANKLGEIEGHVWQEAQSTSAAKSIVSPHPEISVATAGNTIFVSTPHMAETNAILKADGPGAMKWDSGARAYAVKVDAGDGTAQNPGNVGEIRQRLDAVADYYQTKTLVPPHEGRPGLAHPTEAERQVLARANPETYARDADVQRLVDKLNDRVTTTLSEEDRRAISTHRPGEAIQSDRLAQLPAENVDATAKLVQHVQSVQSRGVTQQLEQARAQSRSATLTQ